MTTFRKVEYRGILVELHHAQVEALDVIKYQTGTSRVGLIREAVAMLIGRYVLAQQKEQEDVKVA